jgi:hypothetical protein
MGLAEMCGARARDRTSSCHIFLLMMLSNATIEAIKRLTNEDGFDLHAARWNE